MKSPKENNLGLFIIRDHLLLHPVQTLSTGLFTKKYYLCLQSTSINLLDSGRTILGMIIAELANQFTEGEL